MQTWITDYNIKISAKNLDQKRLAAQIYESIHILASLLDRNYFLINPKRPVRTHPAAKLWIDYEDKLLTYILYHMEEADRRRGKYFFGRNNENLIMLIQSIEKEKFSHVLDLFKNKPNFLKDIPWISNELIQTHRSVLIQKKPEYYEKLFPGIKIKLKMRYDWKEKI